MNGTNLKSLNGKMEQSFLNFKKQYPDWSINGGDELIENLCKFNLSQQLRNSDIINLTDSEKKINSIDNIFNMQQNYYENNLE